MSIPKDPYMLTSFINMKLRDHFSSIDDLCYDLDIEKNELYESLHSIGFYYNIKLNQFIKAKKAV